MTAPGVRWILGQLIDQGNITGLARLQAEAAREHVRTEEGLRVLLAALGFQARNIEAACSIARDRDADVRERSGR